VPEAPADEAAAVPASETAAEPRRPVNVLVYMVDTLRADRLGVYGFDRPVSPRLDAFAADATVFETAIAQSPWTRPSVASVLTGLTPLVHGINRPRDGLSQEAVTLAELLSAHGYRTAAMVANPNIAGRFNLGQGFDSYELLGGFDNGAPLVTDWARQWLDEQRDPERPFFLYLHTVEPHAPYTPEEEFRARFAPDVPRNGFGTQPHIRSLKKEDGSLTDEVVGWLLDLYDAEIAANDAAFGDLLDVLEARGLLDDTVVVFVSDHGEEFMEHGRLEHAKTFYREVIEVPLVVRFPDLGHGRRIAAPVQHVDVMPTLLGYLGVAQPPGLEGRDLTPWVTGEEPSPEDVAATEIHSYLDRRGYRGASVRVGDWRYVDMRAPRPSEELYDVPRDPAEKADVDERHPVRAGWMESRIRLYRHHAESGQLQPTVEHLDKELRERLRALGYI
jgi:arylsulfatase A-like enzyme